MSSVYYCRYSFDFFSEFRKIFLLTAEDVKDPKPKKRSGGPSNGPPAKRGVNRELQKLLQDEGAINMLYEIERGDVPEGKDRLAFKRR